MNQVTLSPLGEPKTEHIAEITSLMAAAMWLQDIGAAAVFIDFMGHHRALNIRIYEGGWHPAKTPVCFDFYFRTDPHHIASEQSRFSTYIKKFKTA